MREELEDAGLGQERVELLWELYEKARAEEQGKQEAPAAALAEPDIPTNPAAGGTQVCSDIMLHVHTVPD